MDAAAYIRVSSASQNHAMQHHAIEQAASRRGDTITLVYEEKESASEVDRPELSRLRRDARSGALPRRLYVFALDRLTRTGIVDTIALVRELHAQGVDIFSLSDPFDIAGPAAELIIAVMAWGSEYELKRQRQRRAAARARREAKGLPWGRPRRLQEQDPLLEQARKMREAGATIRQIAVALKIKRPTLHRHFQRLSQKSAGDADPMKTSEPGVKPPSGS